MKIQKIALIGILFFISVATLTAQNSLPNPNNDNCWSSLAALRACQLQAYNQAQDYAQRCTSYPEFQCNDYYQPQQKASAKSAGKANWNTGNNSPTTDSSPVLTSAPMVQTSSAN